MVIKITTTKEISKYKKILVYGKSGFKKTRTCLSCPSPIIISSENKLASLSGEDIPVISTKTIQDFEDALNLVTTKKYIEQYSTVCIDSISDIAETALLAELPNWKDERKAYGVIQNRMLSLLRQIRDCNEINFYIVAKEQLLINEDGIERVIPKMPGKNLGPELPYLFDYIFPVLFDDKSKELYFLTSSTANKLYTAKDSSNKLDAKEKMDIEYIIEKISSGNEKKLKKKKKNKGE